MTHAIVRQLVRKDFLIWRRLILIFYGVSLTCIAVLGVLYGRIPDRVLVNLGGTLLITPVGTLGMVLMMQTNVFEKAKSTQPFIMSLPVTVREFTLAKLVVNVPVFGALWLVTTGAAFWFAFGLDLGVVWVWYALIFDHLTRTLWLAASFRRGKWRDTAVARGFSPGV